MLLILFAVTNFLTASLLFLIQPAVGKLILPVFGGSPSVWTGCLFFFQLCLLSGYAFSHFIAPRLSIRRQFRALAFLYAASIVALPFDASLNAITANSSAPTIALFTILAGTIGFSFFLLSTTSPLLQYWFGYWLGRRMPYRLYAISNLGSLVALALYPFLIETTIALDTQLRTWSAVYLAASLLVLLCCYLASRGRGIQGIVKTAPGTQIVKSLPKRQCVVWMSYAGIGSLLLASTTAKITQDVAAVPLLWIAPLALYLLTYAACFSYQHGYLRWIWIPLLVVSCWILINVDQNGVHAAIRTQLLVYLGFLSIGCMVCHGELSRSKPGIESLTLFFLCVSAGSVVGTLFAYLVAPWIFSDLHEYPIAVALTLAVGLRGFTASLGAKNRYLSRLAIAAPLIGASTVALSYVGYAIDDRTGLIYSKRNFYGTIAVHEYGQGRDWWRRVLWHGQVRHGAQLMDDAHRSKPVGYYGTGSGVDVAMRYHPRRASGKPGDSGLHVASVGLGVGTVSAYGRSGDHIRYYELDPNMETVSREYFRYRSDSAATESFAFGDARLSMHRELRASGSQRFDVLILDAFSSDSIPVHLLTSEAFELYFAHLREDGVVAVHTSAYHVELSPVVKGISSTHGYQALPVIGSGNGKTSTYYSTWILLTRNRELIGQLEASDLIRAWPGYDRPPVLWTDNRSNMLDVIKF